MYQLNNIKIVIADSYDEMSVAAADILLAQLAEKSDSILGLATGSTPVGMYAEIIKKYEKGGVDFSNVKSFNLDEYFPIQKSNEQSYDYFMHDNLFDHVNINMAQVQLPNGEATDSAAECDAYEQKIIDAGGVDFQLLGIGINGHIGFNEPSDSFSPKTSVVDLQESTITANARFFDSYEDVPKRALSMGIKTIMMAKKVMLVASGANKADAVEKAIFGAITPKVPASALQLHQDVTFVLDKEAAQNIINKLS